MKIKLFKDADSLDTRAAVLVPSGSAIDMFTRQKNRFQSNTISITPIADILAI